MLCDSHTTVVEISSETNLPLPSLQPQAGPRRLNIMLVEDTASDAALTCKALDATHIPYALLRLKKGNEVFPSLMKSRKLSIGELPDLIMLDLGLPCQNGFEILAELSNAPAAIRAIPIIILTGYQHFDYLKITDRLWIPAYINKPCNAGQIKEVLARIRNIKPQCSIIA